MFFLICYSSPTTAPCQTGVRSNQSVHAGLVPDKLPISAPKSVDDTARSASIASEKALRFDHILDAC